MREPLKTFVALAATALLAGCGGSHGTGSAAGLDNSAPGSGTRTFWAIDMTTDADYQIQADKVGEGTRCYVYLERGQTVAQATVGAIVNAFDAAIYPCTTGAFGNEPNPGIDNDAKIAILLLDIRDGFAPGGAYIAGYFDPVNQFLQAALPAGYHSNEREMFYMDIDPGDAGSSRFLRTLAHEFQHMVHFNQEEVNKAGLADDIWLNEAMSLVAPVYSGYGPDYFRVYLFESQPWNSLTAWNSELEDYGVAYMWAQYVKDRIDPASGRTIFWRMLHRPETGISSVNAALADVGYGKDFGGVFRDWAIANYSGNVLSWAGHPEWSYATVNTWPGTYAVGDGYAIELQGLFGKPLKTNVGAFPALGPWSVDYYLFTPTSGNTGSVTWTSGGGSDWASLADNTTLSFGLVSGNPLAFTGAGYLVAGNVPADGGEGGLIIVMPGPPPLPPVAPEFLAQIGRNATVRRLVATTGRPVPVCVHPLLRNKLRPLSERGIRPSLSP